MVRNFAGKYKASKAGTRTKFSFASGALQNDAVRLLRQRFDLGQQCHQAMVQLLAESGQ